MSATGDVLEVVGPRLERLDDRVDRLDIGDRIVGGDERERVRDVGREVVAAAQRLGHVTRVGPPPEHEQRERRRIAADRRCRGLRAETRAPSARTPRLPALVTGEQRRLDRPDRAPPRIDARSGVPARPPAARRTHEPLGRCIGRAPSRGPARRRRRRCRDGRSSARPPPRAAPRSGRASRRREPTVRLRRPCGWRLTHAPPTAGSAIVRLRSANENSTRAHPLRRRHGRRAARIGRNHHAISDRVGGRVGHTGRRPPRRSLGRRAVPARRRGSCRRARARNRPQARARRRARGDRRGQQQPSSGLEGAVRTAARPRAHALREAASPRLRHRAAPPPGRCARRDADRADRGDPEERERQRQRPRRRAAEEDDEPEDELELGAELDDELRAAAGRARPRRRAPLPLPPPDRFGQDDRRCRLRRGRAHRRRPDPHAPQAARRPVPARADRARLRLAVPRRCPRQATPLRARRTRSRSRRTPGSRGMSRRSTATRTSS